MLKRYKLSIRCGIHMWKIVYKRLEIVMLNHSPSHLHRHHHQGQNPKKHIQQKPESVFGHSTFSRICCNSGEVCHFCTRSSTKWIRQSHESIVLHCKGLKYAIDEGKEGFSYIKHVHSPFWPFSCIWDVVSAGDRVTLC